MSSFYIDIDPDLLALFAASLDRRRNEANTMNVSLAVSLDTLSSPLDVAGTNMQPQSLYAANGMTVSSPVLQWYSSMASRFMTPSNTSCARLIAPAAVHIPSSAPALTDPSRSASRWLNMSSSAFDVSSTLPRFPQVEAANACVQVANDSTSPESPALPSSPPSLAAAMATNSMGSQPTYFSHPAHTHCIPRTAARPSPRIDRQTEASSASANTTVPLLRIASLEAAKTDPRVCLFCGFRSSSKTNGELHSRTHFSALRKFICTICGKAFHQKHSLTDHIRTHTKEKPFQCEVCGRGFAIKSNLTAHRRIHTGEKPYECEYCCKAFAHKSNYNVHRGKCRLKAAELANRRSN